MQRVEVSLSTLMKLAGGGHRFAEEMSLQQFVQQGRRALTAERPAGARMSAIVRTLQAGAPLLTARAAALSDWYEGDGYRTVLRGTYPRRA